MKIKLSDVEEFKHDGALYTKFYEIPHSAHLTSVLVRVKDEIPFRRIKRAEIVNKTTYLEV